MIRRSPMHEIDRPLMTSGPCRPTLVSSPKSSSLTPPTPTRLLGMALVTGAALALAACSLAGDITPPAGSSSRVIATLPPAASETPAKPLPAETAPAVPAVESPLETIRVSGTVINGSAGASLPAGLAVTLHGFDGMSETVSLTTSTDAAGAFEFGEVPYAEDRQFVASATHGGVIYGTDVLVVDSDQPFFDPPLVVYESTADSAEIVVDRMHLFFEFSDGGVTVGELFIVSNMGDRTVFDPATGSIEIPVPSNATEFAVQGAEEGTDYRRTEAGFVDLRAIRPGAGTAQILYSYRLGYDGKLLFEQTLPFPVSAVNVLLPDVGVKLEGGDLEDMGSQSIQGTAYLNYGRLGLNTGDSLAFEFSGKPSSASTTPQPADMTGIWIGAGALGLGLMAVGVWWYQRSRTLEPEALPADTDSLLQAIADLDDRFEAGGLVESNYTRERHRLKARLVELLGEGDG